MTVQMDCPNPDCDASYILADEDLGQLDRCKKCGTRFPQVPDTRVEVPPSSFQTEFDSISKSAEPVVPDSFGRYKVVRLLGRGGMGSVYLALDNQLKRQVALKVPHLNAFGDRPDVRERFFREAQAAARFHHPNFCTIHDIGEVAGIPYLTMAFIDGKTLAASIERGKGWPPRRAVEVTRELALALAKAHREGVVHRDLKPANIMVDHAGGLFLMDFGLARWYDDINPTLTPTGAILGTPSYMPPEQAEGNTKAIGPRSDIYSLGVILYELLTGRRPLEGPMTKVLGMIAFFDPPPPSTHRPDLDLRLEAICLKAMAREPNQRYASMDEFAGALAAFLVEAASPAPTVAPGRAEEQSTEVFADLRGRERTTLRDSGRPTEPTPEVSEDGSTGNRPSIRTWITAAAALAAVFFGIIYVATDKGKREVDDPKAKLQEFRANSPEAVLQARTSIEVLQARRDGKAAELQMAEAQRDLAKTGVNRNEALLKRNKNLVSPDEIAKADAELKLADAAVAGKVAELREADAILNQARQLLNSPEAANPKADPSHGP